MAIAGLRNTLSVSEGERPQNWRHGILMLEPNGEAPLYALTAALGSSSLDDPRYHWFEEELPDYRLKLSGDTTANADNIAVTEGASYLKEGDMLMVEASGEIVIVTADPTSDTSFSCVRGFGNSTAAAVDPANGNPFLMLIGSAYEEGSSQPEGRTYTPEEEENFTQIFRDNIQITGTAQNTNYRTGEPVSQDKRRCLTRHSIGIERALWLSRKSVTIKNGNPRRTMNGILPQIPANNTFQPDDGKMSMTMLETYLKQLFRYGSNEKMGFCGNDFLLGLNQACRLNSSYEIMKGIREFGMDVHRVLTPFGTLVVKTHPLFNQIQGSDPKAGGTVYTGMSSWCFVLDMSNLKYRYLQSRDTKYMPNQQAPGTDGMAAGYLTECSLQLMQRKTHGLIKGVTGGIKDA